MPEIIVKLGDNIVQKYFFFQEPLKVGRSPDNEIVIENLAISRNHASVQFEDGRYFVSDLDSSNGTFVNGVRIKKTELVDRDVISIGKHKLYFYNQRTSDVVHQPSMQDGDNTMLVAPEPEIEAVLVINKGRQKGRRLVLVNGQTTLGRGTENDVRLPDWFVSKKHAVIERREQKFLIRDLQSWRHTFVNGQKVDETLLRHGDVIQLGPSVEMVFEVKSSGGSAQDSQRIPRELEQTPPQPGNTPRSSSDSPGEFGTSEIPFEGAFGGQNAFDASAPDHDNGAEDGASDNPLDDVLAEADSPNFFGNGDRPEEPEEAAPDPAENADADVDLDSMAWLNQSSTFSEVPGGRDAPSESEAPATSDEAFAPAAQMESEDQPQAEPQNPFHGQSQGPVISTDDHVEAVYEEMADVSLLAAAGEATGVGTAAREKRVDSHRSSANDADGRPPRTEEMGDEVAMWERALQNKSVTIRKQAARRLKQLTGRDYEY
jgi:pSer/pThr/pTyr-binding forkhead associated (FHA) protein